MILASNFTGYYESLFMTGGYRFCAILYDIKYHMNNNLLRKFIKICQKTNLEFNKSTDSYTRYSSWGLLGVGKLSWKNWKTGNFFIDKFEVGKPNLGLLSKNFSKFSIFQATLSNFIWAHNRFMTHFHVFFRKYKKIKQRKKQSKKAPMMIKTAWAIPDARSQQFWFNVTSNAPSSFTGQDSTGSRDWDTGSEPDNMNPRKDENSISDSGSWWRHSTHLKHGFMTDAICVFQESILTQK